MNCSPQEKTKLPPKIGPRDLKIKKPLDGTIGQRCNLLLGLHLPKYIRIKQ